MIVILGVVERDRCDANQVSALVIGEKGGLHYEPGKVSTDFLTWNGVHLGAELPEDIDFFRALGLYILARRSDIVVLRVAASVFFHSGAILSHRRERLTLGM